ncbi:MAG: ATP-dependent protease, partial [Thiohalocapsa sp.]
TARARQQARAGKPNAALGPSELERDCQLDAASRALLTQVLQRLALSARAYHRILKVARTIADLADSAAVETAHLSEAVGYRRLDRGLPATGSASVVSRGN